MNKFVNLEAILGKDAAELTAKKQGEFTVEKVGNIPYTAIDFSEYKQAKKDCMKMIPNPNKTGGMIPDLDDDKLMVRVIIAAVDKDERSNFTFANKELIAKLGVTTADEAVAALLLPGEVYNMAIEIQNLSGFGAEAKKETEENIKNS